MRGVLLFVFFTFRMEGHSIFVYSIYGIEEKNSFKESSNILFNIK